VGLAFALAQGRAAYPIWRPSRWPWALAYKTFRKAPPYPCASARGDEPRPSLLFRALSGVVEPIFGVLTVWIAGAWCP
jgi:hypothetical protein